MNIKITNIAQVEQLQIGDIIKKFPIDGKPEEFLNELQKEQLETYDIRTINKEYKMIGLVMTIASRIPFASPGDIGRQFISMDNMVAGNIWWLSSRN